MKRYFLILFLSISSICLSSCKKDSEVQGAIYGKWKLTETLADPGDGSGIYRKVTGKSKYITFQHDGKLSGDALGDLYAFEIVDETTLKVYTQNYVSPMTYRYQVTGKQLVLNPPCIEPCGFKFER